MAEDELQGIVAIGEVLAGKYRVERVLGVGGMGVVVAAMHIELEERVALKFLLPAALRNAEAVGRFAREARAAVKIKSEHVARVIDVGKLDSGSPFMVMEFLSGGDLCTLLEQQRQLPIHDVIEYVLQASEAVAEAHSLGIVHRDLKPANLFLARRADGSACVKVLDFGISKMTSGTGVSARDAGMTKTTAVMGSPLYMSPEQLAAARNADPRSDIWALGAILYELVADQPPFSAEALPQLCTKILYSAPPPLSRPDLPPGLEGVILRCLEKDPARRYANVAEFATALAPFGPARSNVSAERISRLLSSSSPSLPAQTPALGLSSPPRSGAMGSAPPAVAVAGTMRSAQTGATWGTTTSPPSKGVAIMIAVGLSVLAVALVGGVILMTRKHPSGTAAQPEVASSAPIASETAAPVVAPPPASAPIEEAPSASIATPASPSASAPAVASATSPVPASGASAGITKPAAQVPRPIARPAPVKTKSLFGDRN